MVSLPIFAALYWLRNGGNPSSAGFALVTILSLLFAVTNPSTSGRAIGANIALLTYMLFAVLISSPQAGQIWSLLTLDEIAIIARLHCSYALSIQPNSQWVETAVERVPFGVFLGPSLNGLISR